MNKYWQESYKRYPNQKLQDFIKLNYQAILGSGHLILNIEDNYNYLLKEYKSIQYDKNHILYEEISDELVRVHLEAIEEKYLKIYHFLFMKSVTIKKDMNTFINLLNEIKIKENSNEIDEYIKQGCPMVSHTDSFREEYHPHYRLMNKDYILYIDLLKKIEDEQITLIRIDGMAGSGKSTLANLISEYFDYQIIHVDDFFLQKHQRTKDRFNEIGGNLDYERFIEEVVDPINQQKDFTYQIFDCSCMELNDSKSISINKGIVIEGSYSLHPKFNLNSFNIFLEIKEDTQSNRIYKRNGEFLYNKFINEWIPKENNYFKYFNIKDKANMIITEK